MIMALADILKAVEAAPKVGSKPKLVYVRFTHEDWQQMEANAGQTLTTQEVKAIVQGVFAGKLALSVAKA
jgi:hypothetical protein